MEMINESKDNYYIERAKANMTGKGHEVIILKHPKNSTGFMGFTLGTSGKGVAIRPDVKEGEDKNND